MTSVRTRLAIAVFAVAVLAGAAAQNEPPVAPTSPFPLRERVSLDSDWRFATGVPEPEGELAYPKIKAWMLATGYRFLDPAEGRRTRPAGNIGNDVAYTKPEFDDSGWRRLDLPHDWGIEGTFDPRSPSATGKLPYSGVGWYRKHLDIPSSDKGKRFFLDVDGAMSYCNIWLNGRYAGGWAYGYSSFRVDLSPFVVPGGENVLAIRLDNPDRSSRWYPGGGIYRNVWLVETDALHIAQYGVAITTPIATASLAEVDLRATIDNDSGSDADVRVKVAIFELDAAGRKCPAAAARAGLASVHVRAGESGSVETKVAITNPRLWDVSAPNRYVAELRLETAGRTRDVYDATFGIRSLRFDPNSGFYLNGRSVRFNGVCDHQDLGALGTALNRRALQRQLEGLKEMGCNAIRTSHNPPSPELLDLADEMGFLVLDEAFDCWEAQKTPPPWASTPDEEFAALDRSRFVAGEFVWTGWDYVGEPTHNTSLAGGGRGLGGGPSDPARSSYFGILDLAGFRKDRFYLYQARWRADFPMAHILPHWTWPERAGKIVPVHVYTSGDSAELFLNGKSLGRKTKGKYEYRLRWDDVRYEPGELKVIAYKGGKQWAEDRVRTAGKASAISLDADRNRISDDGLDLSFITARVADDAGDTVPRSGEMLDFEISGPGELVALDNGDPTSLASFRSRSMKAFNGLCLAIVRAKGGRPGQITVSVRSETLRKASVSITTR